MSFNNLKLEELRKVAETFAVDQIPNSRVAKS